MTGYPPEEVKRAHNNGCPKCGSKNIRRVSPTATETEEDGKEDVENSTWTYHCDSCANDFVLKDMKVQATTQKSPPDKVDKTPTTVDKLTK
jgi:predicted  nucleic acid-binding Zn-ribbon protein